MAVFSSLLRETRQAVELIGDKIEQFTCAAAKRRESVLSFDREAYIRTTILTYVSICAPLTSHVYQLFSRVSP